MSEAVDAFKKKFRLDDLAIHETEHWRWSLRPGQCTLGAGILSAKSFVERFSDLSLEAGSDLVSIARVIENALRDVFAYDKINYLMLMMVDPPVHYHVVPRYSREIDFAGRTWRDAGWPALPSLEAEPVGDDVLLAIRDELRSAALPR